MARWNALRQSRLTGTSAVAPAAGGGYLLAAGTGFLFVDGAGSIQELA